MTTDEEAAAQYYMQMSDGLREPLKCLMPIEGFGESCLVSLEEAVEPISSMLPTIQNYVYMAKQRCKPEPADGLTRDESASIMLHSMVWEPHEQCLYFALNATLRAQDRQKLQPWFSYLKLILTALSKLPPSRQTVYLGVKMDLRYLYDERKKIVWWGFSSCTLSGEALENEQFLGKTGTRTLFVIQCDNAKDISQHSYYGSQSNILLHPATEFEVCGSLNMGNDLHLIQLKETVPAYPLLESPYLSSCAGNTISGKTKIYFDF